MRCAVRGVIGLAATVEVYIPIPKSTTHQYYKNMKSHTIAIFALGGAAAFTPAGLAPRVTTRLSAIEIDPAEAAEPVAAAADNSDTGAGWWYVHICVAESASL